MVTRLEPDKGLLVFIYLSFILSEKIDTVVIFVSTIDISSIADENTAAKDSAVEQP